MVVLHFSIDPDLLCTAAEGEGGQHVEIATRIHELVHPEGIALQHLHARGVAIEAELFFLRLQQTKADDQAVIASHIVVDGLYPYGCRQFSGRNGDIVAAVHEVEMHSSDGGGLFVHHLHGIVAVIACSRRGGNMNLEYGVILQHGHRVERVGKHHIVLSAIYLVFCFTSSQQADASKSDTEKFQQILHIHSFPFFIH